MTEKSRQRKAKPYDSGDLEPADGALSLARVRMRFLEYVHHFAPQVLVDLRREVLPLLQSSGVQIQPPDWGSSLRWPIVAGYSPHSPLWKFKVALHEWAQRYGLESATEDWIQAHALKTLLQWVRFPQDTPELRAQWRARRERDRDNWRELFGEEPPFDVDDPIQVPRLSRWGWADIYVFQRIPISDDDRRFQFEVPGWDPFGPMSIEEKDKWLTLQFEEYKKTHFANQQRRLQELVDEGILIPVAKKRQFKHFEWLVRIHVLKESAQKIVDEISQLDDQSIDVNTVESGADSVAKFIGLRRQKAPRGRPPKTPNNSE